MRNPGGFCALPYSQRTIAGCESLSTTGAALGRQLRRLQGLFERPSFRQQRRQQPLLDHGLLRHRTSFSRCFMTSSIGISDTGHMIEDSSSSRMTALASGELLLERTGKKVPVHIVTLNRPQTLNALSLPMLRSLLSFLADNANKDALVIFQGSGDKAFCAGGGVGLTVHGGLRICTEKTVFSMPEVHIGLFPDCGMTQRLATLQPAGLGLFLGLTGAKLKAADLMRTRLATHYVPCSEVEHALEKLKQGPPLGVNTKEWASQVLIEAGMPPGVPASRLPEAGQLLTLEMEQFLKLYFAQPDSLQNLLLSLEKGAKSCPLCASALQQMKSACPLSLAVTFKAIRDRQHATVTKSATNGGRREAGAAENATFSSSRTAAEQQRQHNLELLRDAMAIELVLICNMTAFTNYNFKEGIRALLLDKDKNPKWRPSTIEEVMMIDVEQLFAPQRPLGPSKL